MCYVCVHKQYQFAKHVTLCVCLPFLSRPDDHYYPYSHFMHTLHQGITGMSPTDCAGDQLRGEP